MGMPFDGPEQFRKQARENIAHGVDFLKVFTTKVINATPFIYHFMSPEELKAVVQEAKSVGITTACHCSGGQGLEDCLEAGIDCLEPVSYTHLVNGQCNEMTSEHLKIVSRSTYSAISFPCRLGCAS